MGLPSPHLKYILKIKKKYGIRGPVLTFGNQDIYATKNDIIRWIKEMGLPSYALSTFHFSQSMAVSKINKEALNYIHARTFFELLGIPTNQYYDIDKFDFDKPVILHDIEKPIDECYNNFFNFIIDTGTTEHIFDVKSVMDNIVRITKIGGYVLQILPASNFLNHGFYQFSPTFFYDFYTSNGFEVVEAYVIEIRGNVQRFYAYNQEKDYVGLFFNPNKRLSNCFLVRKVFEVEDIISPDQYYYKKLDDNSHSVENDFNKSILDKMANYFRSIVPIKYHGIFFSIWQFLKRKTSKRNYFDIKK